MPASPALHAVAAEGGGASADVAVAPALRWRWARFDDLGVDDLYDALALRCRVFILEQGAYLDPDGLDRVAWHLLGRDGHGMLQACLRLVDAGAKYAEPSIGRVVTAPEVRGTGLGHVLMRAALAHEGLRGRAIRISAQAHLQPFYRAHGFAPVGETYLEDDIPHIEMLRTEGAP